MTDTTKPEPPELPADPFEEHEGYCGECGHSHYPGWCDLFDCECRNSALQTNEAHELAVEALRGVVEGLAPDDYAERYEGSDTDEGYCYECQHYHNPVGCDLAGCDCRYNPVYVE